MIGTFWEDIRIQQSVMILAFSLAVALLVFALLLRKLRFLDIDKTSPRSFSRGLSTGMLIAAMLLAITAVLGMLMTLFPKA